VNRTGKAFAAVLGVSLAASLVATGIAQADPSGTPTYRALVVQGSDTVQAVENGMSSVIKNSSGNYHYEGLLYANTAAGATSIQTSLLPTAGDVLKIEAATQTGTVLAAPAPTTTTFDANFVTAVPRVGDTLTIGGATTVITSETINSLTDVALVVAPALAAAPTAGTAITGHQQETVTVAASPAITPAVASSGVGNTATPYNVVPLTTATQFPHSANAVIIDTTTVPAATDLVFGSFDAVGGAFQSKANANCKYIANNANSTQYSGITQNGVQYTSNGGAPSGTTVNQPNSGFVQGGRGNGSGTGAKVLNDALTSTSGDWGCTDLSRASSSQGVAAAGAKGAVNIPFALDGITFGVTTTSNYPRTLTWAQLNAIYSCTYPGEVNSTNTTAANITAAGSLQAWANSQGLLYAEMPQAGSGTRSFVEGALGLTDAQILANICVTSTKADGTTLEEHDLRYVDDNSIAPISIAQSISQRASAVAGVTDKQGRTVLVSLDGTTGTAGAGASNGILQYPVVMQSSFGGALSTVSAGRFWREVYNIIPAQRLDDPNFKQLLVGSTSDFCNNNATLALYGFAADPNCGSISTIK